MIKIQEYTVYTAENRDPPLEVERTRQSCIAFLYDTQNTRDAAFGVLSVA